MKRNSKILSTAIIIIIIAVVYKFKFHTYSIDEVLINKYVYLKKNGNLLNGSLDDMDEAKTYRIIINFRNGLPEGHWEYRHKGSLIEKGEYLNINEYELYELKKILANEIFVIDYWHYNEIADLENEAYISIQILKPKSFFQSNINQYQEYINDIAKAIVKDNLKIKFKYLEIEFVSDFYKPRLHFRFEYTIENGNPILNKKIKNPKY